jgi:MFS family permease
MVEVLAMLLGATGICTGSWWLIFLMLAIMGTQATFFSPALSGSIPELYPESYVTKANGILRMIVTIAILAGIASAGVALDRTGQGALGFDSGRLAVAFVVLTVAVLGLLVSFGVSSRPAADPQAKFPWTGPLVTAHNLLETRKDPLLAVIIGADVFIWFAGSLQILLLNPLGLDEFHLSKSLTSAMIVCQLVGIGVGGLLSSVFAKGKRWFRLLAPSCLVMALTMFLVPAVPGLPDRIRLPVLFGLVGLVGVFGGLFLIPCESFLQVRPAAARKGAVIAAANFAIFAGVLVSGPLSNLFNSHWRPTTSFGIVGALSLITGLALLHLFRRREWA